MVLKTPLAPNLPTMYITISLEGEVKTCKWMEQKEITEHIRADYVVLKVRSTTDACANLKVVSFDEDGEETQVSET